MTRWGSLFCAVLLLLSLTHCGSQDAAVQQKAVVQPETLTPAQQLTWSFTGTMGVDYGTVDGTFSYVRTSEPSAVNVRGLDPNVLYTLTTWTITVHQTVAALPPVTFSHIIPTQTAEFCVGECIFSSQAYEMLRFSDGEHLLVLAFTIPSLAPFLDAPPSIVEDWGPLHAGDTGASYFQSPDVIALLSGGTMTASSQLAQE